MPPRTVSELFPAPDVGKQLIDPTSFYSAIQLLLGYGNVMAVANAAAPGPGITQAVTTISTPPGAGPWNVQMPVALAGLRLTVINLGSGPCTMNPSYNPALGRNDQIIGILPVPTGNVYAAIAYQPGNWFMTPVSSGLPLMPPGDDEPPTDEPPPEEC